MNFANNPLYLDNYPLSSKYDPQWIRQHEMGPHVLWLTESLTQVMNLEAGMRILDLGCGKALSSIFLAQEFQVQVWGVDWWIAPTDNLSRLREVGLDDQVFPLKGEARSLPFADCFFDAIISVDSFHYFGTDIHYLEFYLLKLLKIGGQIGIVSPASPQTVPYPLPSYLGQDWYWLKSLEQWRNQWERTPNLTLNHAQMIPQGWDLWVQWLEFIFAQAEINPHNTEAEKAQVLADKGCYLGFVQLVGCRDS